MHDSTQKATTYAMLSHIF